ncbi:MAG: hypothetical protein ACLR8L_06745, partial [Oscillospiraceae bacterium]
GNKNGHSRFHINVQFGSSLRTFYSIFAGVWLKWVQPLGVQNNGDMSKASKGYEKGSFSNENKPFWWR